MQHNRVELSSVVLAIEGDLRKDLLIGLLDVIAAIGSYLQASKFYRSHSGSSKHLLADECLSWYSLEAEDYSQEPVGAIIWAYSRTDVALRFLADYFCCCCCYYCLGLGALMKYRRVCSCQRHDQINETYLVSYYRYTQKESTHTLEGRIAAESRERKELSGLH
jgi:hypothetical protein